MITDQPIPSRTFRSAQKFDDYYHSADKETECCILVHSDELNIEHLIGQNPQSYNPRPRISIEPAYPDDFDFKCSRDTPTSHSSEDKVDYKLKTSVHEPSKRPNNEEIPQLRQPLGTPRVMVKNLGFEKTSFETTHPNESGVGKERQISTNLTKMIVIS